jgi:hypothetical protein
MNNNIINDNLNLAIDCIKKYQTGLCLKTITIDNSFYNNIKLTKELDYIINLLQNINEGKSVEQFFADAPVDLE